MLEDTLIGQTIGPYLILEPIGYGGMANVYKSSRLTDGLLAAIKILPAFRSGDPAARARFEREARTLAQLQHPHIIPIYDFDTEGPVPYLAMRYFSGGSLKETLLNLPAGRRLPLEQTLRIILEIGSALAYAHQFGLVHRDIKPGNILFDSAGHAILSDFGVVKNIYMSSHTLTGMLVGTPAYMAPEQGLGEAGDVRSDLYALGALFYHLATGQLPFSAEKPLAVIIKHIHTPLTPPTHINPDLPLELGHIIERALAKAPADRYQSADDLLGDLRATVRAHRLTWGRLVPRSLLGPDDTPVPGGAGPLPAARAVSTPVPAARRRPITAWSFAALIAIGLFLLLWVAISTRRPAPPLPPTSTIVAAQALPATAAPDIAPTALPSPELSFRSELPPPRLETPWALTVAPTATPLSPTPAVTPNITATYVASCVFSLELVEAYTYSPASANWAPLQALAPWHWVLRNNGTCTLPGSLQWRYVSGDPLAPVDPIPLATPLAPGESVTLETRVTAPGTPGVYEMRWQLVSAENTPYGPPISAVLRAYAPATATPTRPPATPTRPPTRALPSATPRPLPTLPRPTLAATPTATPTPLPTATATSVAPPVSDLDFNYFVVECHYAGTEWACLLDITPYGGSGGPYDIAISDAVPPTQYLSVWRGSHLMHARRCFPWINQISVRDPASGQSVYKNAYLDPNTPPIAAYWGGSCTLP